MDELLRSAETLSVAGLGVALVLGAVLPFYARRRRLERAAARAEVVAHRYGLHEPASLHPVVDIEACIGTGSCLTACQETDVLGMRDGQVRPISPARCIGHGACERACPTGAIQLVFGTEKRGVDIPRIKEDFETNVPGIYIIGELGGMGLIGNAFEQGRQCVERIVRDRRTGPADALDVVIVGCGPAGLSASLYCLHHKVRFRALEQEDVGGTVRYYPRKKLVLTRPVTVPGYGKLRFREILKEELIAMWEEIVAKTGLQVNTGERVTAIHPTGDGAHTVATARGSYKTKRVILAIGRRGMPRKLGVPGEELAKVMYSLREPEAFQGDRILVVGGGDSAVEAALALADQPGNQVCISYRGERFSRIKPTNLDRVEAAIRAGRVKVLWSTNVLEIRPEAVVYRNGGKPEVLPNDAVAIFAGGELPTRFLEACGIAIDTKFGEP